MIVWYFNRPLIYRQSPHRLDSQLSRYPGDFSHCSDVHEYIHILISLFSINLSAVALACVWDAGCKQCVKIKTQSYTIQDKICKIINTISLFKLERKHNITEMHVHLIYLFMKNKTLQCTQRCRGLIQSVLI